MYAAKALCKLQLVDIFASARLILTYGVSCLDIDGTRTCELAHKALSGRKTGDDTS